MRHEPYYDSELPLRLGLDTERFDAAVDKRQGSGGRKVIVWVPGSHRINDRSSAVVE